MESPLPLLPPNPPPRPPPPPPPPPPPLFTPPWAKVPYCRHALPLDLSLSFSVPRKVRKEERATFMQMHANELCFPKRKDFLPFHQSAKKKTRLEANIHHFASLWNFYIPGHYRL